ncbi:cbb3-type cytochrome oxidase assembly protein CcoS [Rufibacter roseus]|uniref:Cbb3-type cytochrome oxidase assembly protein CcoS n=1 Tax=Rufibacter roseus TaxID=1567108 RepID=A0ABW2DTE0_9BACT|nr:cbb3-type cytochrome oxidase assembly protein CcoS [Rufibacter roseus]
MTIIYMLIGISLTVAVLFLTSFIWAVKSGQYEDDYTPSVRMLFDEEPTGAGNKKSGKGEA